LGSVFSPLSEEGVLPHWTETFFAGHWAKMQSARAMLELAVEETEIMIEVLGLEPGSRVADIPCGDGRISIGLARAGCDVTGIDLCRASVERARRRFRRAGLDGTFSLGDMRDVRLPCEFDAVINWWGSFGYFDERTNLDVLRGLARIAVPGGRVLVDQVNRERVLRQFRRHHETLEGGLKVSVTNRWDARTKRVVGTWMIGSGKERVRRKSSIRLYTRAEMCRLMEAAGLRVENVYDGATGLPYTRGSRRMTTVGRKLSSPPSP
jgi:ubiquinone/menaquinone biosynthesis C-methylase UbiE